jgi:hypothetical protein
MIRSRPLPLPHRFHHHATGIFCPLPVTWSFLQENLKRMTLSGHKKTVGAVRPQENVSRSFLWRYPHIAPGHIISSGRHNEASCPTNTRFVNKTSVFSVDIRVRSKERDLGSRRAGVRRFNSCSTHWFFRECLHPARPPSCRISGTASTQ